MTTPIDNLPPQGDVLVVDDAPANLRLLSEILTGAGHHVRQATSGQLALRSAKAKPPGLILLDVRMPEMDGYEVCRRLQLEESTRSIPVIFVTVMGDMQERLKSFEAGAVDHITKPFQPEEVLARVKTHLALGTLRRDLEARGAELQAVNDRLAAEIEERRRAQESLRQVNDELEVRVQRRTAALARMEHQFRTVAEFTYDWEYWIAEDRRILYMTPSCRRITGYAREAFEADPALLDRIVHPDDRQDWMDHRDHGGTGEEELAFRIIRADGEVRWIGHLCQQVRGERGERQGIRGSNRDITDRRNAESRQLELVEQLRRSQKMQAIGQLAGGISHNFNNLLMAISGNVEAMEDLLLAMPGIEGQPRCLHHVGQLRQAAEMGSRLTRRLLAFCREQPLHVTVFHPNQVIEAMADMLRSALGPGIRLVVEPGAQVGCLATDRSQFEEAIITIAVNAREAMPGGGTLRISSGPALLDDPGTAGRGLKAGPHARITLTDTGRGMEEEVRRHLFEPFFTTKPLGQGAGLSLAAVHGFAHRAGGIVEVDSTPGVGTNVTLLLPTTSDVIPAVEPAPAPSARERRGGTGLVCEDDPNLRQLIGRYLAMNGYDVIEAEDAEQALALAADHDGPLDVLVTDVLLTGLSGPELSLQLKQRYPALRCLLMSGHPDCVPPDIAGLGADWAFLGKPFQLPEQVHAIRKLMQSSEGADQ